MSSAVDLSELAQRWALLWAEDHARMVEEIYAPDVVVEQPDHGHRVSGRAALHAVEGQLRAAIPDHRNLIVRVLGGDTAAVVESVITGTGKGDTGPQACPACVWWRLDEHGQVVHEVAYWEWTKRRPDDGTAAGTLRTGDGRERPFDWYRSYADRLAELWSTDPVRMVDECYAQDCVMERLGEGSDGVVHGAAELRTREQELLDLLPRPDRRMRVSDVTAERDVLAIAFTIEGRWRGQGPLRRGPGTLLLTLDEDDRVLSDRIYWHWSRARPVD
jgi:ketosteroid isomerase-like protein